MNRSNIIDDDYIDVETRRADVSISDEVDDVTDSRSASASRKNDPSSRSEVLDRSMPQRPEDVDMSHKFDTGSGAGASPSVDELIDENAIVENDGRSDTRTFFYPSEADDEQTYSRLIRWQDGEGDPSRKKHNQDADKSRYVDTLSAQLGLSSGRRDRVQRIVDGLNMKHMAHFSSPMVILAVISLVANEDGWFVRDDDTFRQLMVDVGITMDQLNTVRQLVKSKSDVL